MTKDQIQAAHQLAARETMPPMPSGYVSAWWFRKGVEACQLLKWQPIETAPKDGSVVDLWRDGVRLTNMRRVDLGGGDTFHEAIAEGYSCVRDASHWMLVPTAPTI